MNTVFLLILGNYLLGGAVIIIIWNWWEIFIDHIIIVASFFFGFLSLKFKNNLFNYFNNLNSFKNNDLSFYTHWGGANIFFGVYSLVNHFLLEIIFLLLWNASIFWKEGKDLSYLSASIAFFLTGITGFISRNIILFAILDVIILGIAFWGCFQNKGKEFLFSLALVISYGIQFLAMVTTLLEKSSTLSPLYPITYLTYLWALTFITGGISPLIWDNKENNKNIIPMILNLGIGFPVFIFLSVKAFHPHLYYIHFPFFIIVLFISSLYWVRIQARYNTFVYAMIAYLSLTISILSFCPSPLNLLWLCLQSLVVIITALWYRSPLIVLANFFIFVVLFITALLLGGQHGIIYAIFSIIALLSARVLNWKKDRLHLKTELMRNLYLLSAFVILPIALYNLVSLSLFPFSLGILSLLYFILRVILRIKKYYYLSMGTIFLGILFLLFWGISRLSLVNIIGAFFILGAELIVFTLYQPSKKQGN